MIILIKKVKFFTFSIAYKKILPPTAIEKVAMVALK